MSRDGGTAGGAEDPPVTTVPPSLLEATRVWARIGLLSFGGPAGQIALMHAELVERRRWIGEARFLHALNYCMLLPGPEAQQLAIYVGWLLHRTVGGLIAGLLFVLPGLLAILLLAALYVSWGTVPVVVALFLGLKAAILAIVAQALLRIGRRVLAGPRAISIAVAAFVAIHALAMPFPLVVLGAAAVGLLASRFWPAARVESAAGGTAVVDQALRFEPQTGLGADLLRSAGTVGLWLLIWWLPVLAILASLGIGSVIGQQGVFFSQTALVSFGGAYAVLAYVAQRMVEQFAWITPGQMVDGLALAETTPGPLILVLPFLAFVAAFQQETALTPWTAAALAAMLATWVTFAPCFLWIFAGAPYVERLRGNRSLDAALSAITAAVVGVIANLALWFAMHVLFARVDERVWGPLQLQVPQLGSLDPLATALAALGFVLLFGFRVGLLPTLVGCAVAGLLGHLFGYSAV